MLARRRGLALHLIVLPAIALVSAGPANAAGAIDAPDCVGADPPAKTLHVEGSGFFPGSFVSLRYEAAYLGEPRSAALVTANASGAFSADLVPPTLLGIRVNRRTFTLRALDPERPEFDAAKEMVVERVRVTARPRAATSARRRTLWRAYGFEPGRMVYAHFTGPGRDRTVSLGRARGECGRVTRRMSLVPGRRVSRGSYFVYVDQSRRFTRRTEVQAGTQVIVQRPGARRRR